MEWQGKNLYIGQAISQGDHTKAEAYVDHEPSSDHVPEWGPRRKDLGNVPGYQIGGGKYGSDTGI